jgi:2'-5' RNA ligase
MNAAVPADSALRLFVALPVPTPVREALHRAQQDLRAATQHRSGLAWTAPANLHLTLRFLGSVAAEHVPELTAALEQAVAEVPVMNLCCAGLGAFPSPERPRILWAGVTADGPGWGPLVDAVNGAVKPFAETPPEPEFTGHITLARIKRWDRALSATLARTIATQTARSFGGWRAEAVELVRSELLPGGSRYTTLTRCPLRRLAHEPGV